MSFETWSLLFFLYWILLSEEIKVILFSSLDIGEKSEIEFIDFVLSKYVEGGVDEEVGAGGGWGEGGGVVV